MGQTMTTARLTPTATAKITSQQNDVQPMPQPAAKEQPAFACFTRLFNALHENNILYCTLKGNDRHLLASAAGDSDIDVLFEPGEKVKLRPVLNRLGFKEFIAIKPKRFKDVTDFLALDTESGKIVHLHAYFALTTGEPYLKGYQLQIASRIISRRLFNKTYGVYCIDPALEFILLHITESLKLTHRDSIRRLLGRNKDIGEKVAYQHKWLLTRTTQDGIEEALQNAFDGHHAIRTLLKAQLKVAELQKVAPLIRKEFAKYRLYSPIGSLLHRWQREIALLFRKKMSPMILPVPTRRINPRGGRVVTITGPDDRLNARVINLLKDTFAKKLDVFHVAFRTLNNVTRKNNIKGEDGLLRTLRDGIPAVVASWNQAFKIKILQYTKEKGALVLCDRDFRDLTRRDDGSLLHCPDSETTPRTAISTPDQGLAIDASNDPPDLVCVFTPDGQMIEPDSNEMPVPGTVGTNIQAKIAYGKNKARVLTIHDDASLNVILPMLKKEIWNIL